MVSAEDVFLGLPKGFFFPYLSIDFPLLFSMVFLFGFDGQVAELCPISLQVLHFIVLHLFLFFLPSSKPLLLSLGGLPLFFCRGGGAKRGTSSMAGQKIGS